MCIFGWVLLCSLDFSLAAPMSTLNSIASFVDRSFLPPFLELTLLLLALLVSYLAIHKWNHRHSQGPPCWPIFGSSISLARHRDDIHDYLYGFFQKYRTFKVSFPGFDVFFTADPSNVEHMLKTNFANYIKGELARENLFDLFGSGIFSVDGADWKQQRKVASFEFSSRKLRDFSASAFRDYAVKLANLFIHETKAQRPVEMQDSVMRMTLDSVCKVSFGVEMGNLAVNAGPENLKFAKSFDGSSKVISWRYVDPLWKLKRRLGLGVEADLVNYMDTINTYVYTVLRERKNAMKESGNGTNQGSDLLSRFLELSLEEPEEYTDTKIRDVILNFMLAGRDTTAVTLCWFFYMLIENPRVEEKVLQEILEVVSDTDEVDDDRDDEGFPSETRMRKFAELLTYEKLSKMNYLHACLAETLRLYPAVPLDSRHAVSSDRLPDGNLLHKGDVLRYHSYSMGRMEWLWGTDAEKFKPERFLKDGRFQPESPFKHIAFHAGPRMCLGKDSAYLQMKITAAVILRFLKFKKVPGQKVRYRLMITLNQQGLKVTVVPRAKILSKTST